MKRTRIGRDGREDERAVTELVGFVLVFGTVVLAVALVSVVGVQSLDLHDQHQSAREVDRALIGLAGDFDDIARYEGVHERTHQLPVRGGRIETGESGPRVDLAVEHGDRIETESWQLGSLVYEDGSTAVAYEGGGVFRLSNMGERTPVVEPRLACTDGIALVSLVTIAEDGGSYRSDGPIPITATETGASYRKTFSDVRSLEVAVDTDGTDAHGWEGAFDEEWVRTSEGWACSGSNDDPIDRLSVHVVELDVEYAAAA
ncbi:hypothetical protein HALLA_09340 [Halostagnicola larsenii XH-48]|uniref:Uncharacterized protein n=1 Tax=Halostagnicola larsenii XH-48 TaxID=797299 RepID=W0JUA9_9EURY|nr:hypothetical protein [Halostagnicola larsenii]AHG00820.1 hypothetical protein HALLA_09340 [Halostagnicola larsenii XH-48]